jgi:N-formylmaleamate deformylase
MDEWPSGFVETNGVRLHYLRSGGQKTPMLLAHGALDDARCWTRVAEALAPNYDVIAVDARGHGRSGAPVDGYELTSQADDLAGLITTLRLDQPAILGHSMGAEVAPVLAGRYPDLLGAILLEDPGPWWTGWPGTPEEQAFLAAERERYEQLARQPRAALIVDRRRKRPDWTEEECEVWTEAKLQASPHAFQAFAADLDAGVDWPAILGQITCPALLIRTDPESGGVVDQQAAEALQRMLPQLEIAYISGASHSIRRSNLARFMEVVETFLAA